MSNEEYTKELAKELETALNESMAEETASVAVEETAPVAEENEAVVAAETVCVSEENVAVNAESQNAEPEAKVEVKNAEPEANAEVKNTEPVAKAEKEAPEKVPVSKKETKKKKRTGLIVGIVLVCVLLGALAAGYIGVSMHYKDRFFAQTMVNGTDCSDMTIEEVEAILQSQVEEYVLTILKADGESEQILGTDIDITYVGYHQIQEAFAEQNPYLWPESYFNSREIKADIEFTYDEEKLDAVIAKLACLQKENQKAPVNATVVYENGQFVIQEEVAGTKLDAEKVSAAIHTCVTDMENSVDLTKIDCYVQPKFTKDSEAVIAAKDEMNTYLNASITYSLDNIEVTVNSDTFASWISVNEEMEPVISADLAKEFAETLGDKYNTSNKKGVIVTPTGEEVSISNAVHGRKVGAQAESEQLIKDIKSGQTITREPKLSQTPTPEGQTAWGDTYVEVDISDQYMWYIVDGEIVFETDVVTGKKGKNDTPTGVYTILEKIKGKYLRGRLVNGKPSYVTWVDYWMRVTWSGIGFHDAPWQPTFGGDRYVNNGSHGCINMPPKKAKEFYGMLEVGTSVVIHK